MKIRFLPGGVLIPYVFKKAVFPRRLKVVVDCHVDYLRGEGGLDCRAIMSGFHAGALNCHVRFLNMCEIICCGVSYSFYFSSRGVGGSRNAVSLVFGEHLTCVRVQLFAGQILRWFSYASLLSMLGEARV